MKLYITDVFLSTDCMLSVFNSILPGNSLPISDSLTVFFITLGNFVFYFLNFFIFRQRSGTKKQQNETKFKFSLQLQQLE